MQVLDHETHASVVPCWLFEYHRVARELSKQALIVLWSNGGALLGEDDAASSPPHQ